MTDTRGSNLPRNTASPPFASEAEASIRSPTWRENSDSGWRKLGEELEDVEERAVEEPESADEEDAMDNAPHEEQVEYAELYRKAYEEGLSRAQSTVDAMVARYEQCIQSLEVLRTEILEQSQEDLIDLVLHIAREVIMTDTTGQRDFTTRMAEHALQILREADAITLRVGSSDLDAIASQHPELLGDHTVVRIVEDPSISLGGVVAECKLGRVDATLTRRLSDAAARLRAPELQEDDPLAVVDEEKAES